MKKFFLTLAVAAMTLFATAQTNQYFWYQGNLMMGNPIAQIDSVTFGENEPTDTLHILLPRTIIKEVHDTVEIVKHDTVYINKCLADNGALPGEFSISETKKVRFSQGNLQYKASTDTWRFAENQWDYVGNATQGTVYENGIKCDNEQISNTYDGWIDLFGWGTGNNPTLTSTGNAYSDFTDWGDTYTEHNSCFEVNQWRTMTSEEWTYLLMERIDAESLFSFGSINGVNGLIILPDNWTTPDGISFITSDAFLNWDTAPYLLSNANADNYTHNSFTLEQWHTLEDTGAVFLPVANFRIGTSYMETISKDGYYWSSTPDDDNAYYLGFGAIGLRTFGYGNRTPYGRYIGQSVRLVQNVK
ncbi:MAG: hypothetical protein IJU35_05960 [Paludibacteraceae bacterium]|nr:hypothetical protein [Paludibacteraceae bacterium]